MYSTGTDISITPTNPTAYATTQDSPLTAQPLPSADGTTTSDYVDAAQTIKSQEY